jgi:dTDP-4-dehydrorhamnose reductase
MKILITGARGYLAHALIPILLQEHELTLTSRSAGHSIHNLQITPLLLEDHSASVSFIKTIRPDIIVNTAAMSLPDYAEDHREETILANVVAVENLVTGCKMLNIPLVHLSTDYVFSGETPPYLESNERNPVNFYGSTKKDAEDLIIASGIEYLICRTTLLYGLKQTHHRGNPFISVYESLKAGQQVKASRIHTTCPTLVYDLADGIKRLIEKKARGIYHTAGSESSTRLNFAYSIAEIFGFDKFLIQPVEILPQQATRPKNSTLDVSKMKIEHGLVFKNVRDGLLQCKQMLDKIK